MRDRRRRPDHACDTFGDAGHAKALKVIISNL